MAISYEKYQKRRLASSYFSVVVSIALVLFLLGLLGLLVLNTKKISDHFKEQVVVTIYLKDNAKEIEIKQMEKSLAMNPNVKSINFVSKEAAAATMKEENGEDFMEFLGYNPLQDSIDIIVKADFVTTAQLNTIAEEVLQNNFVEEVRYDSDLVKIMNSNVKKISLWVLIFSGLFTLIAVVLINSSLRLAVYSKRFTIKTMQMVGATKSFIRKPFIKKSIQLGIIGALLAMVAMSFVLFYLNKSFPELHLLDNTLFIALLYLGVLLVGILITWLSTHFATQRFLNLKTDQLYY